MLRLVQRHSLNLTGGITDTIFSQVEAWLQETVDHWHALERVACRKDMDRYDSIIDFVFCELHPRMKKHAFAFYAGRGPQLKDMISEKERAYFEARMLVLLEVAYAAFCQQRVLSWSGAVEVVEILAA